MKTNNIKYFICFVIIGIIAIMQSKVNAVKIDTKSHVNIGEEVLVTVDFETYIAAYDGFELSYNERIMKYNSPYELIEGLWWDTSVESTGINKKVYSFTALGNGDNTIRVKIKGLVSANYENRRKTHLKISIDINGNKLPNQYGRDVFVFSIFPFSEQSRGKVVPGTNDQCGNGAIHNELTRERLTTSGCATCKSDYTGYGYGCAALIMKDGWQIKDDYPW